MGLDSADRRKQPALWFYRMVPGKTFSSATINKYLAWESFSVTRVHYPRALSTCTIHVHYPRALMSAEKTRHGTVSALVPEQLCLRKINLR